MHVRMSSKTVDKELNCYRINPWMGCILMLAAMSAVPANAAVGQFIANNTPGFIATAQNIGPEDPTKVIDVTLWLRLHDRAGLDSLTRELYDPTSANYRHWLKPADFAARFAPTAQEAKVVEDFLTSHNLTVVAVGPANGFVRARGTVADAAKAFQVQINKFALNGQTFRANTTDPYIEGPAAALVKTVSGLDDQKFQHPVELQMNNPLDKNTASVLNDPTSGAVAAPDAAFFSSNCFTGVKTENFTTNGTYPTATYHGNGYYSPDNKPGCGYTPAEIQTAYNLTGLYAEGYDGTGQTIVIIDFCGSPTILHDANAFSKRFGLPPLNASNFQIIDYPAAPQCEGLNAEINIDVEWAHAIAPGANIDLLIAGSGTVAQSDEALYFAILSGFGNVISGSYGAPEAFLSGSELLNQYDLTQIASGFGMSANFATGDSGDFTGFGLGPQVSSPASTPFATAVGGVSLALKPDNTIAFQSGWGTNAAFLTNAGYILNPPFSEFIQGSGGGASQHFAEFFQYGVLPGFFRQVPDISWLADPYTGAIITITEPGVYPSQVWGPAGGTSLACPMFSALWAIANQEAGEPLGTAGAYLYGMPEGTITDVVPVGSAANVAGTIHESSSQSTHYTAADLAAPLNGTTTFYSVLWKDPQQLATTFVLTFGTDTSLATTIGWDNVTGLGTPNGQAFADFFAPHCAPPFCGGPSVK
jgi:subtilase family serine protease